MGLATNSFGSPNQRQLVRFLKTSLLVRQSSQTTNSASRTKPAKSNSRMNGADMGVGTDEDRDMHIQRGKLEWNLNTILQILSLAGMLALGAFVWANTQRDILELEDWRVRHEDYHKNRLADVRAVEAKSEERFRGLEDDLRKLDQLEYRITMQEQGSATLARSVEELKVSVNDVKGDLRVMREILERLDPRAVKRP